VSIDVARADSWRRIGSKTGGFERRETTMARRRHAGPATEAKRAAEQRWRDRRREADGIRAMYADGLASLRADELDRVPVFVELLLREAAAGDTTAVRLMGVAQHLTGLGYSSLDQVDSRLLSEVDAIHAGRLVREPVGTPVRMVA
jgi:hypothetical protein